MFYMCFEISLADNPLAEDDGRLDPCDNRPPGLTQKLKTELFWILEKRGRQEASAGSSRKNQRSTSDLKSIVKSYFAKQAATK